MSSPSTEEENISRYLDAALPPEESAALAASLAAEPETARLFARMARTDALLAAAFPARPRRRIPAALVWISAAAAVITVGCFLTLRYLPGESPALPEAKRITDTGNDPTPPPGLQRRTVKPAPAAYVAAKSLDAHFATFSVTADPQGLTVPQALDALERNIRELNLLSRPELNTLRFSAGYSLIPAEAEPIIASPVLPPISISTYLGICANYGQIYLEPGHVLYAPKEERQWDPTLTTRSYSVRPDFLNTWHARHPVKRDPSDPFTPGIPLPQPAIEAVARNYFDIAVWPLEGSTTGETRPQFRYSPAESKLEVTQASIYEHEHIARLLEVTNSPGTSRQYLITCKLIAGDVIPALPGADGEKGLLLDDAVLQTTLRALSQRKGVDLMTTPSITVRTGQRSAIEVAIKEVVLPPGTPGGPPEFDWQGVRVTLEASAWGEFIYLRGEIDIGTPEPGPKVRHDLTGFDLWLPDKHTGAFTLDHTGSPAAAFITVTEVDAAGQPK